ncbi:peptidylprolyl isomerase [Vibrio viridaestus]|uniref:Peptidyl-prolyl cis-trans isomerase n=1 Tax=Vibrio viridaestus TaxID=2487322 RepID=A0A3N9TJ05_9VIBR|nr:peptidylprolyl isomerase [Vibrio viridaestus]RQW63904.1 peptidyl-prolyl cis-trans isomerase [Vibrio viridaestus]
MSKALVIGLLSFMSASVWSAPTIEVDTSEGAFTVELNQEKAPITVANFLKYVKDGSYKGSIFHRVIPGFMVQGGGFTSNLDRLDSYPPVKNEASNGLKNDTGTIAMARTQDPNSATRQFFINVADNEFLNAAQNPPGYAVFGKVTKGFDIVKAISTVSTGRQGMMRDVPDTPIVINDIKILNDN